MLRKEAFDIEKAILHMSQNRGADFARGCVVEIHINMSQEPCDTGKGLRPRRLCESLRA